MRNQQSAIGNRQSLPWAASAFGALLVLLAAARPGAAEEYPLSSAHVAENDAASECIKGARRHLAEGRLERAVEGFQQALDQYPDFVFPVGDGLYISVREYCKKALRDLPVEGKELYLRLYEASVRTLCRSACAARDLAALRALSERYPISPSAFRASARLGLLLLERGQVAGAIAALERARAALPADESLRLSAPLGHAYARAGRRDDLLDLIREARAQEPAPELLQGDRTVPLVLVLQQLFDRLPEAVKPAAAAAPPRQAQDRWPTYGGSNARSRLMQGGLELLPRVWSYGLPVGSTPRGQAQRFPTLRPDEEDVLPPYFPVIADGVVYVHNESVMYALDLQSTRAELLWKFDTGQAAEDVLYERNALHTTTIAGGRVFANLVTSHENKERQLDWLDVKYPFPLRALFAFDTTTGKILWRIGGLRDSAEFTQRASFALAPAVEGDQVYAGAIFYREPTDPIGHYVCCMEAATGRLLWRTEVSNGFGEMNLFNNPTRESVGSSVTLLGDALYYCTNLGVIACLDRETGARRWVRRYAQFKIAPVRDIYPETAHRASWANNPILAVPGYLFVTPTDSPFLYCLDPETGDERWSWPPRESAETMGRMTYLAGVHAECVYVTGDTTYALRYAKGGETKWVWRAPRDPKVEGRAPVAAGALTPDALYLPCRTKLHKLDPVTGRAQACLWLNPAEDPGNLLFSNGVLLTGSLSAVSAFFSLERLERELAEELARNPDDPFLRARAAAGLAKSHAYDKAAEQWARVLELAKGRAGQEMQELALRARRSLFRLYLELGRARWEEGKQEEGLAAFQSARAWSPDARGTLEALFAAYDALREAGRSREALGLMALVLRELPEEGYGRGTAREAAKTEIDRLLAQVGREPFADQEAAAERLLRSGPGREPAEAACLELLRLYPNSLAAETAALTLAREYRRQKRTDEAIERLRAYLKDFPRSAQAPTAYALLIELYEERGMHTSARGLLAQLARRFPTATLPLDGANVPVKTWVERRQAGPAYTGGGKGVPTADLEPPLVQAWQDVEAQGVELKLFPVDGAVLSPAGEPLVFLGAGELLQAVEARTGRLVWKRAVEGNARRVQLHDRILVVLGRFSVTGVEADTGTELWRSEVEDYVTDMTLSRGTCFLSAIQRSVQGESKVLAIDAGQGRKVWEYMVGSQLTELFFFDEFVAIPVLSNREVLVLERETGRLQQSIPLSQRTTKVFPLEPDKLGVNGGNQLAAYELSTGKLLWRSPVGSLGPESISSRGSDVAYFSTSDRELVLVDGETGKAGARQAIPELRALSLLLSGDREHFVVYRTQANRKNTLVVGAYSAKDGGSLWTTPTPEALLRAYQEPILTPRFFLLLSSLFDTRQNLHSPRVLVLDRESGAIAQTLAPAIQGSSSPHVAVQGDVVLIAVGNTVVAFRKP
ncbi:MAG: PQQ-binding-like beta-propeller repeat protein [Planctomycetes bacterium]|nr:PQQ-binding-like beta-propeller repeat protein [Planctomycetota bacterium]